MVLHASSGLQYKRTRSVTKGGGGTIIPPVVTKFTDDFNRANGGLGTNWQFITGSSLDLTIVSSQVAQPNTKTAGVISVAVSPLLSGANKNNYVQVQAKVSPVSPGPLFVCRLLDATNWVGVRVRSTNVEVFKSIANVLTLLGTGPATVVNDVYKLQCIGDLVTLFLNGAAIGTLTDIPLGGDLNTDSANRQGLVARTVLQNAFIDNYEAGVI